MLISPVVGQKSVARKESKWVVDGWSVVRQFEVRNLDSLVLSSDKYQDYYLKVGE
jgi:hypothetical protein